MLATIYSQLPLTKYGRKVLVKEASYKGTKGTKFWGAALHLFTYSFLVMERVK